MLPSRSKTPADRSPASRTGVEKAVRTRVCACSSTTAISRDHMICMWICDSAVLGREIIGGSSKPGSTSDRADILEQNPPSFDQLQLTNFPCAQGNSLASDRNSL